jgi:hypothetical protein
MAPAVVGPGLRLEGRVTVLDAQVHLREHLRQDRIRFDFQVVRLQLDGHMPVAQVVGRPDQIKGAAMGGAGRDAHDRLGRRDNPNEGAVLAHQDITATHDLSAGQEHAEWATP